MLRKLGQPDQENLSPEKRRAAVLKIRAAEPEGQALLKRLAAEDEDASVRSAALGRLEEIPFLHRRYQQDTAVEPRRAARAQLGALLAAVPPPAAAGPALIALYHPSAAARRDALAKIQEPAALAEVAAYTQEEKLRRAAAERITDISLLKTALRQLQDRNKSAARILRERIKALQQQHKEREEQVRHIETMCADLEALAVAPWDKSYAHRLQHFLGQWRQVTAPVPEPCRMRRDAAAARCEAVLDAHRQRQEAPVQACELLESAAARLGSPEHGMTPEDIDALLEQETRDWKAIPEYVAYPEEIKTRREQARSTLRECSKTLKTLKEHAPRLKAAVHTADQVTAAAEVAPALKQLDSILKKLPWPADVPVPTALAAARQAQAQLAAEDARSAEHKKNARQQIDQLFARLHQTLQSKRFGPARSMYQQLREKLAGLPAAQRAPLQQRLESLEKQLESLADWKSFATEPKLQELCQQMGALCGGKMHPRERARRIKALQEKWRALGSSPAADALWPRFRESGDKAFALCAEFFAKEKAQREQNLAKRQRMLRQLEECLAAADREKPDWQQILPLLDAAEREWEQQRALPAAERPALEKSYQEVRDSLRTLLAPVLQAHEMRKRTLIKQAQELAAHKRAQQAAAEGRLLRDAWKQLGGGNHAKELQAEFDAALEPVFSRLREERETAQQARRSEHDALRETIARIAELAQLGDEELTRSREEYQACSEQAEAGLEALPEQRRASLQKKFQTAAAQWQQRFDTLDERQGNRETEELMRLAALCRQLEEAPEEHAAMAQQVETAWGEGIALQNSLAQRMEARRQAALANAGSTQGSSEQAQARHLLCVRLEILAERDSPQEDAALRMQYQMERLQQGLGQDCLSREDQLEQLRELSWDWLCGPVAGSQTEQALAERFETAYTEARKRLAPQPRAAAEPKKDQRRKKAGTAKRQRPADGKKRRRAHRIRRAES